MKISKHFVREMVLCAFLFFAKKYMETLSTVFSFSFYEKNNNNNPVVLVCIGLRSRCI